MLLEYLLTRYMRNYTKLLTSAAGESPGVVQPPSAPPAGENVPMLYIHVPFCKELCPFCTFFRIPFDEQLARRYFAALKKQLQRYKALGYTFTTVYIGGGTPTVLPDELASLIGWLREHWNIKEISVETNPSDLTPQNIDLLKEAGVNRLSVGVQSFQDNLLASVNRIRKYGTSVDIQNRLLQVRGVFDTVNVDLIFGLEGQKMEDVTADLEIIKRLEMEQVTCYPLMHSGGKKPSFKAWKEQALWEKNAYQKIRDSLEPEYSTSSAWCFSRNKGMIDEYIVEYTSYAGAGAGAFGLENGTLTVNVFSVQKYIEAAENGTDSVVFRHAFQPGENLRYKLLMQLFGGIIDVPGLLESMPPVRRLALRMLMPALFLMKFVVRDPGRLSVTKRGSYFAMLLMKLFFEGVGELRGSCVRAHATGTNLDIIDFAT